MIANKTIALLLLVCVLGTSCRMFAPTRESASKGYAPEAFSSKGGRTAAGLRWWEDLQRPELNRLLEQALRDNLSLAQASARLRQAEALALQRGAGRWPEVTASASGTVSERKEPLIEGGGRRSETYQLGLAASYEIDLWGRVSAVQRGARLGRDASAEDLVAAELSVAAEVTLRYLELMNVRAKLDLLDAQRKTNQQIADLIDLRFRRSQASALDVFQQRGNIAGIDALLPPLRARESLLLHELAVLTGQPAGTQVGIKARSVPTPASLPDPGLPADLLARRPDVRAALRRLEAADWAVSAARAERLPALRLTGSAAYSNDEINTLFDNWIAQLVGNLAGPLIDGSRRKAEVIRTRALADERVAAYRATVLKAVQEVEDALILSRRQLDLLKALERQRQAADLSYNEALSRYQKGMESYLSALVSMNNLQKTERALCDAVYDQAAYRVRLCRALAGSWKEGHSE